VLKISASSQFKDNTSDEYKSCSIKATINPKLFTGIQDYVTAASEKNLRDVEMNFNLEADKISPILGYFNSYLLNRIDYCFNVDAEELRLGCTTEQLMTLIKRSNIPPHFEERQEYDLVSHRMKTDKNTFYLQSKSVTTNCYSKHYQLSKNFPDCPNIEDSLHVIRFEIQCKYLKVYNMLRNVKRFIEHDNVALLQEMLSDHMAQEVIEKYFNRVIRKGFYYPLETAKNLIRARNFSEKKDDRLISALELINRCRSITKAKTAFNGDELEIFKRSIRELEGLNINPVTIPREWNINHIPNLLFAYENAVAREESRKRAEECVGL
jgi:hypothetical protein